MKNYNVRIETVSGKSIVMNMSNLEFEVFMQNLDERSYVDIELSNVERVRIYQRGITLIDILIYKEE